MVKYESNNNLSITSAATDDGKSDTCTVSGVEQNVYKFALDLVQKVKDHYRDIEITRANHIDFGDITDCKVTQKQVKLVELKCDIQNETLRSNLPSKQ